MANVLQFLFWLWNFMLLLQDWRDRQTIRQGKQELAFFCSHAERHGLHTAHTAPRLSIHQIQKYQIAVCAVFVRVILCANVISADSNKGGLLQKLVKRWRREEAKKSIRRRRERGANMANNWKMRERRGEALMWELLWRVSLPQGSRGWVRMEHRWVLAQVKL